MRIIDVLKDKNVSLALGGKSKNDIIVELVELASHSKDFSDKNKVITSTFEREKTMSTGIGHGVAIPHGKSTGVKKICTSLGISKEGIEFDSLDGKPVHIFFLVAAPEGPAAPHIKFLSRISRLLNMEEFRKKLINSKSKEEVIHLISEEESKHFEI